MYSLIKASVVSSVAVLLFGVFAGVGQAQEQWGFGPVLVFTARNGGGSASSFGVGEYRADRYELGQLRNDSAYSVMVPNGYRVRFCEDEGRTGQGDGRCEEFSEGNHNLQYGGTASYIRVWGPTGGFPGGGWNGGGQRGVVVYEDQNSRGRSEDFGVGRYLNTGSGLGRLRNDAASSVTVSAGFRVRLCENEGNDGRGSGACEEYSEGRYNLRYNDTASFIEVRRTSGCGGGTWDNPRDGGGQNNNNNTLVIVYTDANQRGSRQSYAVGAYRFNAHEFGSLANDAASSIFVPVNYRVRLCESEGNVGPRGRCEDYGPGSYNLRYSDTASYIEVRRGNDRWSDEGPWNGGGPGTNPGSEPGVLVYVDRNQQGTAQEFREGTYRFKDAQFGRLPNDAASSIFVRTGFRVRLCENEGRGPAGERCEEYGPGRYNLAYDNSASSVFVFRN